MKSHGPNNAFAAKRKKPRPLKSNDKLTVSSTSLRTRSAYRRLLRFDGYRLKAGQFPLLWLYSSRAYPRIVESIILFR
jgi:hypothetical protein